MYLLNLAPLLSFSFGILLVIFLFFRKTGLGQNKRIRIILGTLILIYTLTSLDHFLYLSNSDSFFEGFSYLFFHLTGYLFLYFITLFTKYEINVKKWTVVLILHTIIRLSLFVPLLEFNNINEFLNSDKVLVLMDLLELEYLLSSLINIGLIIFAFIKLNKKPLILSLSENQKTHYRWIKLVVLLSIVLGIGIFINAVINSEELNNLGSYLKLETLLIAIFFFVFAYSIMHFPVFVFSGNFEDLPEETKQKYAKSSLINSSDLFNQINNLVKNEELHLDFDLKLNTVAEKLDKSVHHISQAINQQAKMSFPDFINSFRIEEAKKKLLESKPDTIFAISLDVGFNSKAAFYTAFKKFTNQTPTEFKRSKKE